MSTEVRNDPFEDYLDAVTAADLRWQPNIKIVCLSTVIVMIVALFVAIAITTALNAEWMSLLIVVPYLAFFVPFAVHTSRTEIMYEKAYWEHAYRMNRLFSATPTRMEGTLVHLTVQDGKYVCDLREFAMTEGEEGLCLTSKARGTLEELVAWHQLRPGSNSGW